MNEADSYASRFVSSANTSQILGEGVYSTIYSDEKDPTIAIKAIKYDDFASFIRETLIINASNHPNIIKIKKFTFELEHAEIYMHKYEKNLTSIIRPDISLQEIFRISRSLFSAVAYLHARGIIHGDLKPQNILLGRDGSSREQNAPTVMICDFGVSVLSGELIHTSKVQTCIYRAPEVNAEEDKICYSAAVDVWSLGCILFELCVGERLMLYDSNCNDSSVYASAAFGLPTGYDRKTRMKLLCAANVDYIQTCICDRLVKYPKRYRTIYDSGIIKIIAQCLLPAYKKRISAAYGLERFNATLPTNIHRIEVPAISVDDITCCYNLKQEIISNGEKCLPLAEKIYVAFQEKIAKSAAAEIKTEHKYAAIYIASCLYSGSAGVVISLTRCVKKSTLFAAVAQIMAALGGRVL